MIERVLYKVIVQNYYRRNVGFFALLVIGGFAFFRGEEHMALARYATENPVFLFGLFGALWALYTVKVLLFVLRSFAEPVNEFLYHLRLLPPLHQAWLLIGVQLSLLQPILYYGIFVAAVSVSLERWVPVSSLVLLFAVYTSLPVALYMWALRRPNASQQFAFRLFSQSRFTWPSFLFFPLHLLRHEPVLLFLTKAFGCSIVMGTCLLYPTDAYDHRLISLGLLVAGMAQGALIHPFHGFEQLHLPFLRNMPLAAGQRFAGYLLTYIVLLLPELVILARNLPEGIGLAYLAQAIVFLVSLPGILHHFLYFRPLHPDKMAMPGFWFFIAVFFVVMFRVPVFAAGGVLFLMAWYFFAIGYYRTEYPQEN